MDIIDKHKIINTQSETIMELREEIDEYQQTQSQHLIQIRLLQFNSDDDNHEINHIYPTSAKIREQELKTSSEKFKNHQKILQETQFHCDNKIKQAEENVDYYRNQRDIHLQYNKDLKHKLQQKLKEIKQTRQENNMLKRNIQMLQQNRANDHNLIDLCDDIDQENSNILESANSSISSKKRRGTFNDQDCRNNNHNNNQTSKKYVSESNDSKRRRTS